MTTYTLRMSNLEAIEDFLQGDGSSAPQHDGLNLDLIPRPILEYLGHPEKAAPDGVQCADLVNTYTDREDLPYARGEREKRCQCVDGYHVTAFTCGDVVVQLAENTIGLVHPCCVPLPEDAVSAILANLPPLYRQHRTFNLVPTGRSPIAASRQQMMIDLLAQMSSNLRGWLLVGPPGTSKTTYVSALIVDMLTSRACLCQSVAPERLNCWRIKVPTWLDQMQAHRSRDFENDSSSRRPSLMPDDLDFTGPSTPILWLEEVDKFRPTETRLQYLYQMVDKVYEAGGLIITSSNMTCRELRDQLGGAIYRRLSGEYDDPEQYKTWDLFAAAKPVKSKAAHIQ